MASHCRYVINYHRKLDRIGRVIGAEARRVIATHDWTSEPALDPRYEVCVRCHTMLPYHEEAT